MTCSLDPADRSPAREPTGRPRRALTLLPRGAGSACARGRCDLRSKLRQQIGRDGGAHGVDHDVLERRIRFGLAVVLALLSGGGSSGSGAASAGIMVARSA